MEVGIKGNCEFTVTEEMLASRAGSGAMAVFSSPIMIAKMERTASLSVMPFLGEDKTTVGIHVDVRHKDATPEGMTVTVRTELTGISENGKILTFKVEAFDEFGLIGEGLHERAIIDKKRFMEKVDTKLKKRS